MCLSVNKVKTTELRKKLGPGGTFIAYKILRHDYVSPYVYYKYTHKINVSKTAIKNRHKTPFKKLSDFGVISEGFHVWMTKARAEESLWSGFLNQIVVKVKCRVSDLIAVGHWGDAVLTRIEVLDKRLK